MPSSPSEHPDTPESSRAASPLEVTIRPARLDDLEVIVDFNARLAEESEGRVLPRERLHPGVRAALESPEACAYFIAEHGGRIVGQTMLTYEWSDWRNGRFWWIQSVYVVADARRRGVFRQLYQHIQRLARDSRDCCGLRLYVELHNEVAQRTYQRLGMKESGYLVLEEDWTIDGKR